MKYIIFSVGSEYYAVNILNITIIEEYKKPLPVYGAPGYISGIIDLRNDIIPVIDMRYVFGCDATPKDADQAAVDKMLITNVNGTKLALLVDGVDEIFTPSDGQIHEIPELVKCPATEYADGVIKKDEEILLIVSPDKVLTKAQLGEVDRILEEMSEV